MYKVEMQMPRVGAWIIREEILRFFFIFNRKRMWLVSLRSDSFTHEKSAPVPIVTGPQNGLYAKGKR
jgi:hypothetical protein